MRWIAYMKVFFASSVLLLFSASVFWYLESHAYAAYAGVFCFICAVMAIYAVAKKNIYQDHFCEDCGEDFAYWDPVIQVWEAPEGRRWFNFHDRCAYTLGIIPLKTLQLTEKRRS